MKIFFLVPILFISFLCGAKPYFVDFDGGDDANAGAFAAAAWKHAPGDEHARSKAGRARLSPGDTVFFKGGVHYEGTVVVRWSGSRGAPIVYDGNVSGSWGAGRAIIDGGRIRMYGFVADAPVDFVTVRGFDVRHLTFNAAMPWGSGRGIYFRQCRGIAVDGCFVHDIGYWVNDGSVTPSGYGIVCMNPTECTVTGCSVTRTGGTGIWLDGAVACTVSRNDVHHFITWGIDLSGGGRECVRNVLSDNSIHDLFQYDKGFWKGAGDPPHTDYIFIRKGNGTRPSHNVVERNLFYNNYAFSDFGGTAMLFLSYADSTIIRNNVFINAHGYSAVYFGWTSRGSRFYNNTVFSPRTAALRLSTGGDNDARNNIFVAQSSGITLDTATDEEGLVMDRNLYCMQNDDKAFARASPWEGWNFDAWRARGHDAHSIIVSEPSRILFVNDTGYPLTCLTMDFHLRPRSPAIGAGAVIAGFGDDAAGGIRATEGTWDAGAFSYVSNKKGSGGRHD
jgi:hypothetical protein